MHTCVVVAGCFSGKKQPLAFRNALGSQWAAYPVVTSGPQHCCEYTEVGMDVESVPMCPLGSWSEGQFWPMCPG